MNIMNTNHSIYIVIIAIGFLLVRPFTASCASPDGGGGGSTNTQISARPTNHTNETVVLHRTIVDESSERYAVVDLEKEVVTLKDKTDKVIWQINVAERLKTESNPKLRGGKIERIQIYEGDLWVAVGRGWAVIDIKTGELKHTVTR